MFGAPHKPAVERPLDISALGKAGLADLTPTADARRRERLERMIHDEIVPRLMLSHRVGPVPPSLSSAVARKLSDADVTAFVAAIRGSDDGSAVEYVRTLVAEGAPIEAIYVDLLAPTARRLGTLWDADECDFVEVTVAMGRIQRLLRDLSQHFLADSSRADTTGNALLTCVPGEQHTLGVIIVAEFLLRDGWRVLVGAPWTESDLLAMVANESFDVIGFSVGCENRLSSLKREIRRLRAASRNPNVRVMVGGQVFIDDPEMVSRVGADAYAVDARQAPHTARALLHASATTPTLAALREATSGHGELSEALRRE
jgi:MerR family transcriptional regulator, light-induced transcriptional regulator